MTPPIRTFKARRGRLTARQRAMLTIFDTARFGIDQLPPLDQTKPLALEIGFGTGESTLEMAARDPQVQWVAIDVHTPGVADLIGRATECNLTNLFVIEADAFAVLHRLPHFDQVHTYFPDPWPKARHHKRRLITAERVAQITTQVKSGGTWHLATDWAPYADVIGEVFATQPDWSGGVIDRPERPLTHYERKALREGRRVTDFRFDRMPKPPAPSEP